MEIDRRKERKVKEQTERNKGSKGVSKKEGKERMEGGKI